MVTARQRQGRVQAETHSESSACVHSAALNNMELGFGIGLEGTAKEILEFAASTSYERIPHGMLMGVSVIPSDDPSCYWMMLTRAFFQEYSKRPIYLEQLSLYLDTLGMAFSDFEWRCEKRRVCHDSPFLIKKSCPREDDLVYFIQPMRGGAIKIGVSYNPQNRLRDYIQPCSPLRLRILLVLEGGHELEADLHRQFRQERLWGEWFRPSKRLLEYVGFLKAAQEEDDDGKKD